MKRKDGVLGVVTNLYWYDDMIVWRFDWCQESQEEQEQHL